MKIISSIVIGVFCFASAARADMVWTDNGAAFGPGLLVDLVYPQFVQQRIIFRASDGKTYAFPWTSSDGQMTENAKAVLATLLTAVTAGKRVSLYYNDAETSYITVQLLNIHD